MRRRVVITGAGLVSALGDDPNSFHEALLRGKSAVGAIKRFERDSPAPARGAAIEGFDAKRYLGEANLRPLDRTGQLAVAGAQRALESSGWTAKMRESIDIDLVLGTMFCCVGTNIQFDRTALVSGPKYIKPLDFANTVINSAAGQTAIWHHLRGVSTTISAGSVSGLHALQYATRRVALGWSEAVLVGGVEELCFETWFAFAQSGHLQDTGVTCPPKPFSQRRSGFLLGEGSGYLLLEASNSAASRGATVLGEMAGYGSSYDVTRGSDEKSAVAAGVRAVTKALEIAAIGPKDTGCIGVSGNGSPTGDRSEAWSLGDVFGTRLASIPAFSVAGALGETLGASGLFQTIAMLESGRSGRIPPTAGADEYDTTLPPLALSSNPQGGFFRHGLVVSNGFDGSSAAVVIKLNRARPIDA